MNLYYKQKSSRNRIGYTLLVVFLLCAIFLFIVNYIYKHTEDHSVHELRVYSDEVADNIELQMLSDRENLDTMANFAAELYAKGEGYDTLLSSFRPIGLIENIGLLLPDNTFITKIGNLSAPGNISFSEEAARGKYISGKVRDITNPAREVIRSAVPVVHDGRTVAILYGVIELDTLRERYSASVIKDNARIYILERGNGNFIVNINNKKLSNISDLSTRTFGKGYSYRSFYNGIIKGENGYSSFTALDTDELLYLYYQPLDIADWQIVFALPEKEVFANAHETISTLFVMFSLIVLVMGVYIALIFATERKQSLVNLYASKTRKLLLEINQQQASICEALETIALFAKSRSAFFIDSEGEDYNFIVPAKKGMLLSGEDRAFFVSHLLNYISSNRRDHRVTVSMVKIVADGHLKKEYPEFYDFLKSHDIKSTSFAGITDKDTLASVLGVVNQTRHAGVRDLLSEVAICFSMAIYNKKHLNKTETIAVTDSLTGLSNRVAYKRDVAVYDSRMSEHFSCIYIDANELHMINNKQGHAAGDGMLIFIANTLREEFPDSNIYRVGGDEFLIFTENLPLSEVTRAVNNANQKIEEKDYNVSIGVDYRAKNIDTEAAVKEAEKRMYEAKAEYYQQKNRRAVIHNTPGGVDIITTGIREIDTLLKVMSMRYLGIYCVSLTDDSSRQILTPAYLRSYTGTDESFSKLFSRYVHDLVHPDFRRPLLNFLRYDVLGRQLSEGHLPGCEYSNMNGERFRLTVHPLSAAENSPTETLWIFEAE